MSSRKKTGAKRPATFTPETAEGARSHRAETQAETAERLTLELGFPVTRKMVRLWKEKGFPMADPIALSAKLRNQERCPIPADAGAAIARTEESAYEELGPKKEDAGQGELNADNATPDEITRNIDRLQRELLNAIDYETARTIKTQIGGMREIIKVQEARGVLMPTADAVSFARKAAQAGRNAWEKIEDELPPMLEGLTAAQMKVKLRAYARLRCIEMSAGLAFESSDS